MESPPTASSGSSGCLFCCSPAAASRQEGLGCSVSMGRADHCQGERAAIASARLFCRTSNMAGQVFASCRGSRSRIKRRWSRMEIYGEWWSCYVPTLVLALSSVFILTKHSRESRALDEDSGKGIFGPWFLSAPEPTQLSEGSLCSSFPDGFHSSSSCFEQAPGGPSEPCWQHREACQCCWQSP